MNWETNRSFKDAKSDFVLEGDMCEHLHDNPMQKTYTCTEHDSFGVVSRYSYCEQCYNEQQIEEDNVELNCYDCSKVARVKEGVLWTAFDYYPQQGDVPIFICDDCSVKVRHIERCRNDAELYRREIGE